MFDMPLTSRGRSVLQRRSSISNTVQAGLDGLAVMGIAYWLIDYHIGLLTSEYIICCS